MRARAGDSYAKRPRDRQLSTIEKNEEAGCASSYASGSATGCSSGCNSGYDSGCDFGCGCQTRHRPCPGPNHRRRHRRRHHSVHQRPRSCSCVGQSLGARETRRHRHHRQRWRAGLHAYYGYSAMEHPRSVYGFQGEPLPGAAGEHSPPITCFEKEDRRPSRMLGIPLRADGLQQGDALYDLR